MTTRAEEIEAQRRALPPERLLPAYRLDEETRARYRSQPILRGTAFTKAEQLNLGEAAGTDTELGVRVSK